MPQIRRFTGGLIKSLPIVVYVGPGDIVSGAIAWWGLRAYTSASIGSNAIRLREDGGNTESDFATIAGGGLPLSAISSFKGANNLFVTKFYDQSGNGRDLVQATAAKQPAFTLSGLGSLPIITFDTNKVMNVSPTGINQPWTFSHVTNEDSSAAASNNIFADGVTGQIYYSAANAHNLYMGSSVVSAAASDNNWHAIQDTIDNASSEIYVDGSGTAVNLATAAAFGSNWFYGAYNASLVQPFKGSNVELGIWSGAMSSGNKSSLNTNQHTYYGF